MPKRLCSYPRCPEYAIPTGKGRCRVHAREQRRANRSVNDSFYASKPWRMTRRRYLLDHEICERCEERLADSVHHRTPLKEGGARRDPENLMALCRPCHSTIHGEGRVGVGFGG
jgi:5-methylcytosine-specific restriction protein A